LLHPELSGKAVDGSRWQSQIPTFCFVHIRERRDLSLRVVLSLAIDYLEAVVCRPLCLA
jgi:hypothetical protein